MQVAALRFHWVAYADEIAERAEQLRDNPRLDDWWRLFWGYVEIHDAAAACRLAIEADGLGFEAFNVTAADTLSSVPTEELLKTQTPEVEIREPIEGFGSAFSIEKARRLLGYDPKRSWRS
jgi:nucleoside-diphosphate-sugar epimerase